MDEEIVVEVIRMHRLTREKYCCSTGAAVTHKLKADSVKRRYFEVVIIWIEYIEPSMQRKHQQS